MRTVKLIDKTDTPGKINKPGKFTEFGTMERIARNLKSGGGDPCYVTGGRSYTYAEVFEYVSFFKAIIEHSVLPGEPVLVYGHKEIHMPAAFLACVFAGVPYIPVDSSTPKTRIDSVIEQARPKLIVGNYACPGIAAIGTDLTEARNIREWEQKTGRGIKRGGNNRRAPEEDPVQYIMFTSGTSGKPKGVMVTRKNVDSCVQWLLQLTGIKKGVVLNQALFSFDLSVADLYLSLVTGSVHYLLESGIQRDFPSLFRTLKESNATFAVMTPSFAKLLLADKRFDAELMPGLGTLLFCGEILETQTAAKLFEKFPGIKVINSYGPTECTFAVTGIEITRSMLENPLPIGAAKPGVKIHIVDNNLNALPEGEPGEILIEGASVAKGYVEPRTNESTSFLDYNGTPAYITGDIGMMKDGLFFYQGRRDRQVKFQGYRIELEDIERNLADIPEVEAAAAEAVYDENGKVRRVAAFVVLREGKTSPPGELRKALAKKLPAYMLPAIKIVPYFPLTQNGKRDTKKLLELFNNLQVLNNFH